MRKENHMKLLKGKKKEKKEEEKKKKTKLRYMGWLSWVSKEHLGLVTNLPLGFGRKAAQKLSVFEKYQLWINILNMFFSYKFIDSLKLRKH
jgi:hypothetical protein